MCSLRRNTLARCGRKEAGVKVYKEPYRINLKQRNSGNRRRKIVSSENLGVHKANSILHRSSYIDRGDMKYRE